MRISTVFAIALAALSVTALLAAPNQARADANLVNTVQVNARLISVVTTNGGCVSGPTGNNVEAWDMASGFTYKLTIDQVTGCAHGGTDVTIQVIVKNSTNGNTPVTATRVSTGVYTFNYTMPPATSNGCTYPILYCTTGGDPNTGSLVGRHDTGASQSHLRAAAFGAGCTNPTPYASCVITPARLSTWGVVRTIYR